MFRTWKKSCTPLRLTAVTNGGKPEIVFGDIFSVDEAEMKVGFVVSISHEPRVVELEGATFRVGKKSVEANRGEDFLTFEPL